MRVFFKKN